MAAELYSLAVSQPSPTYGRGSRTIRRCAGRPPSCPRCRARCRLRGRAISGRVRLTCLDLDFVGVDDSYLCDTETLRYRATRRR